MLICKNCQSHKAEGSTTCSTCKMPGMLVRDNTLVLPDREARNGKTSGCRNCGHENQDHDTHCRKCKFPIQKNRIAENESATKIKN